MWFPHCERNGHNSHHSDGNQGYQFFGSGLETEFCLQPDLVQIQEPLDFQAP
jgi:hypothetical protein